jgi:hypothetical protein
MAQFLAQRKKLSKAALNQWRASVLVLECYIRTLCGTMDYQREHHLSLRNQARTMSQVLADRRDGKVECEVSILFVM